jgi:hypothetical protein
LADIAKKDVTIPCRCQTSQPIIFPQPIRFHQQIISRQKQAEPRNPYISMEKSLLIKEFTSASPPILWKLGFSIRLLFNISKTKSKQPEKAAKILRKRERKIRFIKLWKSKKKEKCIWRSKIRV